MSEILLPVLGASFAGCAAFLFVSTRNHRAAQRQALSIPWIDDLVLSHYKKRNQGELKKICDEVFPNFLDIVVLGLSAGLSFDASIEMYCDHVHNSFAYMLKRALFSWRIGMNTREEALYDLASQCRSDSLRRFATMVNQSLELGSPLSRILQEQAECLREEQKAQVSEKLEKLPIKMLIPMGVLVVPAMLLALLGPLLSGVLRFN